MSAEPPRALAARPPPPPRSCLGTLVALAVLLISAVYLLNLGAGVIELVPDNLPIVGHLDEFGASAALLAALRYLLVRRRPAPGPIAPPDPRG